LEGQLVNAADEIAYTTHDLDDGLRSGLIQVRDLGDIELWNRAVHELGIEESAFSEMARRRAVRYLINQEVTDVIDTINHRLGESGIQTPDQVRDARGNIAGFSPEMGRRNRQLKDVLLERLYHHYRVIRMQVKAQRLIRRLFGAYLEEPRQLPPEIQSRMAEDSSERVVCDYIAGMTDRFAIQEYRNLFDPSTRG
jgi:dGTPase